MKRFIDKALKSAEAPDPLNDERYPSNLIEKDLDELLEAIYKQKPALVGKVTHVTEEDGWTTTYDETGRIIGWVKLNG